MMAGTVSQAFETAIFEEGLTGERKRDRQTGASWLLTRYPDGTWLALSPAGNPQWWNGAGRWKVEMGNNAHALRAIRRGPPTPKRYDLLPTGLPEDWMGRLQ